MLSSQFLLSSSRVVADDEARPTRNKRLIRISRDDSKPRRFLPSSSPTTTSTPSSLLLKKKGHNNGNSKMKSSTMATMMTTSTTTTANNQLVVVHLNPLLWMQEECPQDVLPKILSYCGPQMASLLNQTNTFWRALFNEQATWRIMSEELYKWKEGENLPNCWKEYYRLTPCVPTDYSSIPAALAVASDHNEATIHDASNMNPRVMEQRRSLRILLRPGEYTLKEAIVIQAVGDAVITIETMDLPISYPSPPPRASHAVTLHTATAVAAVADGTAAISASPTQPSRERSPAKRILKRASNLTRALSCRSVHVVVQEEPTLSIDDDDWAATERVPRRAKLISKTRRHNEPVLRVRQGTVSLKNLAICHNSHGIDIWSGNAAIQIQPPLGPDDAPHNTRPTAFLEGVEVSSKSGRGICNIDGGMTHITRCLVHDCAATGIYVGGPGSSAVILQSDVIRNGNGNRLSRRGIARGHSGIYLEQGRATVVDCNISQNSLTGISAVSMENAILSLEQSDLVANGTTQLEMPPDGSLSRRRSLTRNNFVANEGLTRSRSGLVD